MRETFFFISYKFTLFFEPNLTLKKNKQRTDREGLVPNGHNFFPKNWLRKQKGRREFIEKFSLSNPY